MPIAWPVVGAEQRVDISENAHPVGGAVLLSTITLSSVTCQSMLRAVASTHWRSAEASSSGGVPVVVHHGTAIWRVSRQFADEVEDGPPLRDYVPACIYHLIDLSGYRDDELQGAVMLQTALLTLKSIFRNELRERLPEILGLLRDLVQSSMGLDYVRTLLRYLAQAASIDRLTGDQLRQVVTDTLTGGGELLLTIAEQWEQQAMERVIEKGIERGIEKGIEQGEARLLKQLLTWRFGALPPWVESQLAGAEPERLETAYYGDSIFNTNIDSTLEPPSRCCAPHRNHAPQPPVRSATPGSRSSTGAKRLRSSWITESTSALRAAASNGFSSLHDEHAGRPGAADLLLPRRSSSAVLSLPGKRPRSVCAPYVPCACSLPLPAPTRESIS